MIIGMNCDNHFACQAGHAYGFCCVDAWLFKLGSSHKGLIRRLVKRHPTPIGNFEFSPEAIAQAIQDGRLLSMEIEFSQRCNFRCPYCYVPLESQLKDELTLEEIQEVIVQAKNLGAAKIIILGG